MKNTNFYQGVFLFLALGFGTACSNTTLQRQTVQGSVTPDRISVEIENYVPAAGRALKDVFVRNFSVDVTEGFLYPNNSRDTVSDALKNSDTYFGFTVGSPNSANPFYSDLVIFELGIKKSLQSTLTCDGSGPGNTSNDGIFANATAGALQFFGLRDCEKTYLKLDITKFDNNQSGIPDYLQLRCGLNPADKSTYKLSSAGDGVSNYEKCKRGIPIDEQLSTNLNFASNYFTTLNPDGSYGFKITNIPVANSGKANLIVYYITEVNLATGVETLYSAFTILKGDGSDSKIAFKFWGTDPAKHTNQNISF